jgi:hypothetical protein
MISMVNTKESISLTAEKVDLVEQAAETCFMGQGFFRSMKKLEQSIHG